MNTTEKVFYSWWHSLGKLHTNPRTKHTSLNVCAFCLSLSPTSSEQTPQDASVFINLHSTRAQKCISAHLARTPAAGRRIWRHQKRYLRVSELLVLVCRCWFCIQLRAHAFEADQDIFVSELFLVVECVFCKHWQNSNLFICAVEFSIFLLFGFTNNMFLLCSSD